MSDVDTFLADGPSQRQLKLFVNLLAVDNTLQKIIAAAPTFQVSDHLKKNIQGLAFAVISSKAVSGYKKASTVNTILEIVKTQCFDLPPSVEKNHADWAKVTSAADYELTQARSKFKKEILASLRPAKDNEPSILDSDRLNIYDLTKMIQGTRAIVSIQLCARVALMRKVLSTTPSDKFWDKVDEKLAAIRKSANQDNTKVAKALKHYLDMDRAKFGTNTDYSIKDDDTTEWLDEVDAAVAQAGAPLVTGA